MTFAKTKRKDLHKAMQALRRLISTKLKIRRFSEPVFEQTILKKQWNGRFTFKGDASGVQKLFEQRGFSVVVGMAADQHRIRMTKTFTSRSIVYTARVVIYPDMKRVILIVRAELESAPF